MMEGIRLSLRFGRLMEEHEAAQMNALQVAAVLGAGPGSALICKKTVGDGITLAVASRRITGSMEEHS